MDIGQNGLNKEVTTKTINIYIYIEMSTRSSEVIHVTDYTILYWQTNW